MPNEKKEPPKSAEELLERYAAGERDFEGVNLNGANLMGSNLSGADFSEANLIGANLIGANFQGAHLADAKLQHASLQDANLIGANFQGAHLEDAKLHGTNFQGAKLSDANFSDANLIGANLIGANLADAGLQGANLIGAHLLGADFQGANFQGAHLRDADLAGAHLLGADFQGADLRDAILADASLIGANFQGADLRDANLKGAQLDGTHFHKTAFNENADLLPANWQTLRFGNKTYHREAVERGEEVLPVGMGPRLAVLIETGRLRGAKNDAAVAVVDYLANAGIEAKVETVGGAGSVIRLSVRARDDAEILLQAGDGVCRLLGLGSGVENLLPSNSSLTAQAADAIAPLLDERFDLARRQAHLETDQLLSTLETIGREDVRSVKLAGFTDAQMDALKNLAELGSEYLEVKVDEENKEAWMTPGQQVARDVYESQVAKPLRTIIETVFQSLTEKPEDE